MAGEIGIDVTALRDLAGRFAKAPAEIQPILDQGVKALADDLAARIREKAPLGQNQYNWQGTLVHQGGTLRQSISVRAGSKSGNRTSYTITIAAPYAAAVWKGRRAVTIRPVSASLLSFLVGGRRVFAREVSQPARPGRPFVEDALREVQLDVKAKAIGQAIVGRLVAPR